MSTDQSPEAASPVFEHGDQVYLEDGSAVMYVAATPSGHVVSVDIFEGEGDEEYGPDVGSMCLVVPDVFTEPPVKMKHEAIAKLDARIEELHEKFNALRQSLAAEEKAAKARHAELAKWSGLKTLEDFIAGRITHLVFIDSYNGPRIETFEKGMEYSETEYGKTRILGMKLLTLFGNSKGDLTWQIYKYRDPSSSSDYEVRPATSYEEAVEIARLYWNQEMNDRRAKGFLPGGYWVKHGKLLGFEVPADIAEKMRASAIANAKDYLAKAEAELTTRRAALAALEADGKPTEATA